MAREGRPHPQLYFGGASEAAQRTAAAEADVQLFWGEPLDGVAARIDHLRTLSAELDRDLPPLEFGLRITTLVRETTEEAWADAEAKVAAMAEGQHEWAVDPGRRVAVGQQRLLDLAEKGDVLDDCLYTAPGRVGGGGAGTTWLVGSPDDVAKALRRTPTSASPTSCSPTRRTSRRSCASATRCCRSCADLAQRRHPSARVNGNSCHRKVGKV